MLIQDDLKNGFVRLTDCDLAGWKRSRLSRGKLTPLHQSGRSVLLKGFAWSEVTVLVEMVVDRGVSGSELLQGLDLPEARHRSFSSSERLM